MNLRKRTLNKALKYGKERYLEEKDTLRLEMTSFKLVLFLSSIVSIGTGGIASSILYMFGAISNESDLFASLPYTMVSNWVLMCTFFYKRHIIEHFKGYGAYKKLLKYKRLEKDKAMEKKNNYIANEDLDEILKIKSKKYQMEILSKFKDVKVYEETVENFIKSRPLNIETDNNFYAYYNRLSDILLKIETEIKPKAHKLNMRFYYLKVAEISEKLLMCTDILYKSTSNKELAYNDVPDSISKLFTKTLEDLQGVVDLVDSYIEMKYPNGFKGKKEFEEEHKRNRLTRKERKKRNAEIKLVEKNKEEVERIKETLKVII